MADGSVAYSTDEHQMYAELPLPEGRWRRLGTVDKEALYKAGLEDEWQQLMRKLAATVKESA